MVKSGLNDENIYVNHIRLAIHFMVALGLLVYTFWFALKLLVPQKQKIYKPSSKRMLSWIIALLLVQLIYGAFMAGLKAASSAPTWPDINGSYFPAALTEGLSALINNSIAVHFIHRNLAYLIFFLIIFWSISAAKEKNSFLFNSVKWLPLILVCIQVALGIAAVLTSLTQIPQKWGGFEWNALLHQAVAMFLLLSLVIFFYLLSGKDSSKYSVAVDKPVI